MADAVEEAVLAGVEATGVPFQVVPCDPSLADTAAFCDHYGFAMEDSANTIVVASKREPRSYVACVVLATTRLDVNGTVKRRMAAGKVSFASADETVAVSGMQIGGVTPFALPQGMPLWVDSRVMDRPAIILGGGSRSMKIRVSPKVLEFVDGFEVVEGLAALNPSTDSGGDS